LTVRLAVVWSDPLRLKIVTELSKREMSANEFFEEFGGGSSSRVSRHFGRLEKYAWLEYVRTETGGSRRGSKERFYRATGPAAFDNRTWSQLPDSIRRVYSLHTFEQLAERITAAMETGSLDARSDRPFTSTPVLLDRRGWENAIAKTDALFEYLFEEQDRAKLRMSKSGGEPIPATIALAVFESPDRARKPKGDRSPLADRQSAATGGQSPLDVPHLLRLSKVLDSEVRLKIVTELSKREMSAKQFFDEFGGRSLQSISGHFTKLRDYWWFDEVRTETGGRRHGAVERFYCVTGPEIVDDRSWAEVPDSIKRGKSWRTFERLAERIMAAMEAGTFDARLNRHFTWTPILLDRLGWENVLAKLDALLEYIIQQQEQAKRRMPKSGKKPIRATFALAAFESAKDPTRAP
jgi:DNA-binding transcriptional ArsR family regulator